MQADSELVLVGRFSTVPEAEIARSVLDAAGIPVYVRDANIVGAQWLYSNAVGGVKLLVPADQREEAVRLLETPVQAFEETQPAGEGLNDEDVDRCANCGGTDFEPVTSGRRWAALTWLFAGVPLFPVRHARRCRRCGATLTTETSDRP